MHGLQCDGELPDVQVQSCLSWDIIKLKGPAKGVFFSRSVLLDIFWRHFIGWLLTDWDQASLAERLIAEVISKQAIPPGRLTVHADRGFP